VSPRRTREGDTAPLPVIQLPSEAFTATREWEPQVYEPEGHEPEGRPSRQQRQPRPARPTAPAPRPGARRNEPEPEAHSRGGGLFALPQVNMFNVIGQTITGAVAAIVPFILTAVFISTWLWVTRGFATDQAQIDAIEHILGRATDGSGAPWMFQAMPQGIHNQLGGFILAPYVILFIGALGFLARGKFIGTAAYLAAVTLYVIPYNAFVGADPLHIGFFRVMANLNPFTLYGYVFP
jgi:hypothetical protein